VSFLGPEAHSVTGVGRNSGCDMQSQCAQILWCSGKDAVDAEASRPGIFGTAVSNQVLQSMTITPITIRPVATKADRKAFVQLPFGLYAQDPAWVAPLKDESMGLITPAKTRSSNMPRHSSSLSLSC
jgi:hypothetical protein